MDGCTIHAMLESLEYSEAVVMLTRMMIIIGATNVHIAYDPFAEESQQLYT